MKKAIIVSAILAAITLTACGGSKSLPSSKAISVAKQAISVGEKYLDGSCSYNNTQDKLDDLKEEMEYVSDSSDSEKNKSHSQDFSVSVSITDLSHKITMDNINGTSESHDDVSKAIEDLKNDIGE